MPKSSEMRTTKANLRQQHLMQRKRMVSSLARDLSCQVQRRVLDLSLFAKAHTVGLYAPLGNEVDTQLLCKEAHEHGAVIAYPSVVQQNIEFVRYTEDCAWVPKAFGILEPQLQERGYSECVIEAEKFDIIIVPGVAFDRFGNRLGYGKGFYDRYLPQCRTRCVFIGLAYDFQLEDRLPCEHHDVYLDYVITDTETVECMITRRV